MDTGVVFVYKLMLSPAEFRIVSKSLRGINMTDDERTEAKLLQRKMLEDKHRSLLQAVGESDKAMQNIENA